MELCYLLKIGSVANDRLTVYDLLPALIGFLADVISLRQRGNHDWPENLLVQAPIAGDFGSDDTEPGMPGKRHCRFLSDIDKSANRQMVKME